MEALIGGGGDCDKISPGCKGAESPNGRHLGEGVVVPPPPPPPPTNCDGPNELVGIVGFETLLLFILAARADNPKGEEFCLGVGLTGIIWEGGNVLVVELFRAAITGAFLILVAIKWAGIGDFKTERSCTRNISSGLLSISSRLKIDGR